MALDPRACDLVSLGLLASVAATGSIGAGARRHGLSQPAASTRLRELENTLGVALLDRGPTGSRPTPTGALVIEWAQPLLRAAATFHEALATLPPRSTRDDLVRVATSTTIAEYLLPHWLGALRRERPSARAVLSTGNSTHVLRRLRDGSADLGFAEGAVVPDGLNSRTVARDELVLVVPPEHPWARRREVTPHEVSAVPLVTREPGSGSRSVLDAALRAVGAPAGAPPAMEVSSATAIKYAVTGGTGIGVLSRLAAEPEIAAGALVAVPVERLDLRRELRAVWTPDRLLGPAAEALVAIAGRPR